MVEGQHDPSSRNTNSPTSVSARSSPLSTASRTARPRSCSSCRKCATTASRTGPVDIRTRGPRPAADSSLHAAAVHPRQPVLEKASRRARPRGAAIAGLKTNSAKAPRRWRLPRSAVPRESRNGQTGHSSTSHALSEQADRQGLETPFAGKVHGGVEDRLAGPLPLLMGAMRHEPARLPSSLAPARPRGSRLHGCKHRVGFWPRSAQYPRRCAPPTQSRLRTRMARSNARLRASRERSG